MAFHRILITTLLLLIDSSCGQPVTKTRDMLVTPHPLATAAGEEILSQGGTAVDAMVAVQTVLGLVEPQASGLGGGAFAVYHEAATGKTITIDARETAPAAATEDRFAGLGNFFVAWQSGLSVGVPGVPRMMEHMHQKYGKLPWKDLFQSAQKLATEGFELSERTSTTVDALLEINTNVLGLSDCNDRLILRDPVAYEYFVDASTCTAKPSGTLMTNLAYNDTLTALANDGADAFYKGTIAEDIVAAVQGDLALRGDMTTQDMEAYQVIERDPVCFEYKEYNVCGMGPPSSGALAVGQMLGILETFDFASLDPFDPLQEEAVHFFSQADR